MVFVAILWVKLLEMFVTLLSRKSLCRQVNDHVDTLLNEAIKLYLNNMVNLHQLTPHIIPSYTYKMTIVYRDHRPY